jgi:hypothetical protein
VQGKSKTGKDKTYGGDNVTVKIEGPQGEVKANVQDTNDGKYTVTYKLPVQGSYQIHLLIDGKDIQGSPFTQKN